MITIFKYTLTPDCDVHLPADAEVLSVGVQGRDITIWVKLDDSAPKVVRRFVTFGTGHDIDPELHPMRFIGTSFLGSLVFHTFEVLT